MTFADASASYGLNEPVFTMGCNYGDLNNDGFLDFYLGTGEPNLNSIVPNKMYLNHLGRGVIDVTYKGGFGHIQKGHAVGFADMDLDGEQDVYAVMGGAFSGDVFHNAYFENPLNGKQNWISIKLMGKDVNRSAIGTRVRVVIEEDGISRPIFRTVSSGASFGGNCLTQHIGVGNATSILNMTVIWPNKTRMTQTFQNLPVNKHYTLEQGDILRVSDKKSFVFQAKSADDSREHH
jgi:hypothetical protein